MDKHRNPTVFLIRWLFVVCCWNQLSTSALKHFRGGSSSFEYIGANGGFHKVRITTVMGWDVDDSPCGPHCSDADVGKLTRAPRDDVISRTGSETHFGEWHLEIMTHDGKNVERNITAEVNSKIEGQVTYVSVQRPQWMQEVASFELDIEDCVYVDVIFTGSSWIDLQMQDCRIANCRFYIQQKIKFGVRDDTGAPNNSPRVLYQAVNRIEPNQVSQIPLSVTDVDGDKFECNKAGFRLISFPQIGQLSVNKDCAVTIDSATFPEDSWGMVNIVVQDKPRTDIAMGGTTFLANSANVLSQIQVQFLVQVARALLPAIVSPTACVSNTGHTHTQTISVEAGGNLRIPVYTTPNPGAPVGTEITDVKITCLPTPTIPLVVEKNTTKLNGKDWRFDLVWETAPSLAPGKGQGHPSQYLLQVFARDNHGYDSEACSFQLEVKQPEDKCTCENDGVCHRTQTPGGHYEQTCYCPLGFSGDDCSSGDTDPKPKKPTFDDIAGIPNGGLLQCLEYSHCTFAVHTIGRIVGQPPLLKKGPKSPELEIRFVNTGEEKSTALAGNRFVTSVVVTTGPTGMHKFCVNAVDAFAISRISATYCYHVRVIPDPHRSLHVQKNGFAAPTPPDGSEIPCLTHSQRCNLLVYTHVLHTGNCPEVQSVNETTALVIISVPLPDNPSLCVSQVLLFSSGGQACVQLESKKSLWSSSNGEKRCYTVKPTLHSASLVCRMSGCNKALGGCLATPDIEHTQCVCYEHLVGQLDQKCFPLPVKPTASKTKAPVAPTKPKGSGGSLGPTPTKDSGSVYIPAPVPVTVNPGRHVGAQTSIQPDQTTIDIDTTVEPGKSLGHGGSDTTEDPEKSLGHGGSDTTVDPGKLLGHGGSDTTVDPGKLLGHGGSDTTVDPGKLLGHGGSDTIADPRKSLGHGGSDTTVDPRKSMGHGGSDTTVDPRKSLGHGGSDTTVDPGKLLGHGGSDTTADPRKSLGHGGSDTTVDPGKLLGHGGSDTTMDPGKPLAHGGSDTTVDPGRLLGHGGSDTTVDPGKLLGHGGSDTTADPRKSLGHGGSDTTVDPRKSMGHGGSDTTMDPGKPLGHGGSDTTVDPGKLLAHGGSDTTVDPGKLLGHGGSDTIADPRKSLGHGGSDTTVDPRKSMGHGGSDTTVDPRKSLGHGGSDTTVDPGKLLGHGGSDTTADPRKSLGHGGSDTTVDPGKLLGHGGSDTTMDPGKPLAHGGSDTTVDPGRLLGHGGSDTTVDPGKLLGHGGSDTTADPRKSLGHGGSDTTVDPRKSMGHGGSDTTMDPGKPLGHGGSDTTVDPGKLLAHGGSDTTVDPGKLLAHGGSDTTMDPGKPLAHGGSDTTVDPGRLLGHGGSDTTVDPGKLLGHGGSDTTADPRKSLGHGGSDTTVDPRKSMGHGGSDTTMDPGKPLGHGGSDTTVDPGKSLGHGGSDTTVGPGKPMGHGGSDTTMDPRKLLGHGGSDTTVDPGKSMGHSGSDTTVDPGKLLGHGGSDTTVDPGKPLGHGGSDTTMDPRKLLGHGGSDTTVDPGKSMGHSGSDTTVDPGKLLGHSGSDTTVDPGKPLGHGGSDTTVDPGKSLGHGGSDTTMDPRKLLGHGGSDTTVDPGKSMGHSGSDTTVGPGKPMGHGGSDTTMDSRKLLGHGGSDTTVDPEKSLGHGGLDTTVDPGKSPVVDGHVTVIKHNIVTAVSPLPAPFNSRQPGNHDNVTTTVKPVKPSQSGDAGEKWTDGRNKASSNGESNSYYDDPGFSDRQESCLSEDTWRKAFKESRVKCACVGVLTGESRVVIRPRVSTERLLRAFLIGLGVSSSSLVLAVLIFCFVSKKKWC